MNLWNSIVESTALSLTLTAVAEPGIWQKLLERAIQPMALIGWIGQTLFFSRFVVQWIVSEKQGRSTIPIAFWYLSIGGGMMLLIYAIWRRDPVITAGQTVGLFVYARNLILIHRTRPIES